MITFKRRYDMLKALVILYIVCFGFYILYTRHPDFFDGEQMPATIHFVQDSAAGKIIPKAIFRTDKKDYAVDARYVFREWKEGERVTIIYEKENPAKAAVYSLWGYWMQWKEILGSIIVLVVLFQIAVAITKNPVPEALIDQVERKEPKKRKYMD